MTRFIQFALLTLFASLPVTASAAVADGDFPAGTVWYMHADLQEMRTTDAGRYLYAWLDDEIFSEINEETGVDLEKEIDQATAFSSGGRGAVIVLEGSISQESKDKMLAVAQLQGNLDLLKHGKTTYYHAGDERSSDNENSIESLEDSAYFTFALEDKLIVASDEDQLKALIDNKGKIAGSKNTGGALFVMTAEKEFVQAGMRTDEIGRKELDWDSNILQNIELATLLVSDSSGMIAIEANLVSKDAEMAQSVASIINGLIGLQAFSQDIDPELSQVLNNTKINVDDKVLSIKTVVDSKVIVDIIDD